MAVGSSFGTPALADRMSIVESHEPLAVGSVKRQRVVEPVQSCSGNRGTRRTTNWTQCPPDGSTTSTCPSRSSSTSKVRSRGGGARQSYHTTITRSSLLRHPVHAHVPTSPNCGLDGSAWVRLAMRPASRDRRPASTAARMLFRHQHRIVRLRHRGIDQHGGAAELHGERRVRGGADPGVEHDRHRRARADQLDQMRVGDAQARSRSASRAASPRRRRRRRACGRSPDPRCSTAAR